MPYQDSVSKIVTTYIAAVTKETFVYGGTTYNPKPLHVTPLLGREFKCVLGCGGCCTRFTLDYLPSENKPNIPLTSRYVTINNTAYLIHSYEQHPEPDKRFCDNLDVPTGKCGVHGKQPFSCDFETVRFYQFLDHTVVRTAPYGRGWQLMKVNGARGALCEFGEITNDARAEANRRLRRLAVWCEYFGIRHKIPRMLEYLEYAQYDAIVI